MCISSPSCTPSQRAWTTDPAHPPSAKTEGNEETLTQDAPPKVLIYSYATGMLSLSGISRKLHDEPAFRGRTQLPCTPHDSPRLSLKALANSLIQVMHLARERGWSGGLDCSGRPKPSDTKRRKAVSYGHMFKAEAKLKPG